MSDLAEKIGLLPHLNFNENSADLILKLEFIYSIKKIIIVCFNIYF